MYSEIKSNNKILINRVNENESILLENIYNKASLPNSKIVIEKLTDETGDFGGVFIEVIEEDLKTIDVLDDIVEELDVYMNEPLTYTFPVAKDVTVTTTNSSDKVTVTTLENTITVTATESVNDVIHYTISKEGYKSVTGEIKVYVITADRIPVTVNTNPENANVIVLNQYGTRYYPNKEGNFMLGLGIYKIIAYLDTITKTEVLEITEEDLAGEGKVITLNLITIQSN